MRTSLILFTAVAVLSTFFQLGVVAVDPVKAEPVKIQISTDRQDALYKCGEKATFLCVVMQNGKPLTSGKAAVRTSNDGMKTISTMEFDLAENNPFKVEGTMTVPGFLQCEVKSDRLFQN